MAVGADALERRLCLSAPFTPGAGSPVAVGVNPHVAAVADFNGDGKPDLAVANANDNTVTILLGNGTGGFTAAPGSPVAVGAGPFSVAAGDFNGDGEADLVVTNSVGNSVSILLGNASGGFAPAPGSPVAVGTTPSSAAVADLNGDGKADLAVANSDGNSVSVLLGNGTGGFTAAPGSPLTVGTYPFSVVAGDFNGDGKTDLAMVNARGNSVSILLGNGTGGFTAAPGSPITVGNFPSSATTGDFNGDGKADLAVADFNGSNVSVLLGNGDGTFTAAAGSPVAVGTNPYSIKTADFNGDGKADLATANFADNTLSVLLGNGSGGFTAVPGSPVAVGAGPDSLTAADVNGDARPDLIVSNSTDNTVSVLLDAIPAPLPTGTLGASVTASLPASVVGGAKAKVSAVVTVTAPAGAPINGPVAITLYVSPAQSLTGATQVLVVTPKLKLKAGARKALRIKLSSFPSEPAGIYFLVATVKGLDGTTTGTAGPSLTISPPFVTVLTSNLRGSPAALRRARS